MFSVNATVLRFKKDSCFFSQSLGRFEWRPRCWNKQYKANEEPWRGCDDTWKILEYGCQEMNCICVLYNFWKVGFSELGGQIRPILYDSLIFSPVYMTQIEKSSDLRSQQASFTIMRSRRNSGGPLDSQTWQTEWNIAPLAKMQFVWVRKPNFESFCCSQPFVCQVWLSNGPPECDHMPFVCEDYGADWCLIPKAAC